MKIKLILVLILQIYGYSLVAQTTGSTSKDKIDSIFSISINENTAGAAAIVSKNGQILYKGCFGLANLEHSIPISDSTVFDIASLSKQFTGFGIALLIERGIISLDDNIRDYIPELHQFDKIIKISHLLYHTSGFRDMPYLMALAGWKLDDVRTFDQMLNLIYRQKTLNYNPGDEFCYSNTNYIILAELIQRVTNMSFRDWMSKEVFKPLGMVHTFFHDNYKEMVANKAYPYSKNQDNSFNSETVNRIVLGASCLYTTIEDLSKWLNNLSNPKPEFESTVKLILQKGSLNNGSELSYASGIIIGNYRNEKVIFHEGSVTGYTSFMGYYPKHKLSMAILMNFSPANPNALFNSISDIYLANEFPQVNTNNQTDEIVKTVKLTSSDLEKFVGTYKIGPAWYVTLYRDGDTLMSLANGGYAVPMTPRSDSLFWIDDYGTTFDFRFNGNGEVSHFIYYDMTCNKIENKPTPAISHLSDFVGTYYSDELQTIYTVQIKNDSLILYNKKHLDIRLNPAWKDDFSVGAWFLSSIEFERDENGKVTGFNATQYRCRNNKFVKLNNTDLNK